jgi:hypothetical protein
VAIFLATEQQSSQLKLKATVTSRLPTGTAWLTAKRYNVFPIQESSHKNNKINSHIYYSTSCQEPGSDSSNQLYQWTRWAITFQKWLWSMSHDEQQTLTWPLRSSSWSGRRDQTAGLGSEHSMTGCACNETKPPLVRRQPTVRAVLYTWVGAEVIPSEDIRRQAMARSGSTSYVSGVCIFKLRFPTKTEII